MFGYNWVDLIIIAAVVGAAFQGFKTGFLVQLFVVTGFFGSLFIAGSLFPHLMPIHDRTLQTLVNANLVLAAAFYAGVRCYDFGKHLRKSAKKKKTKITESIFGSIISVGSIVILVWLLAVTIGRLPFAGLSNSANDAFIVQTLDRWLPPAPAVFASFNRLVDPNSSPYIFAQSKAEPLTPVTLSTLDLQSAVAKAARSTVRITSFGCGGVVSGSGFVVAPGLVATNAHVVAGVERPIIKDGTQSYEAITVLFDPGLDLAYLRAKGLPEPALDLARTDSAVHTNVAVLGYPKGNYTAAPGIIRNSLQVFGRNIYDVGVFGRDIYEIQTSVDEGSSGGPVVLPNGSVAGIIFGKSKDVPGYGYALTSPSLLTKLAQAEHNTRRVNTGACLAD